MRRKLKILFVTDKLATGGTERQLVELMKRLDPEKFELFLCCLWGAQSGIKEYLPESVKAKTILLDVKSTYRLGALVAFYRLVKFIRVEGIDIVQSYFLKARFIGTLAGRLAGAKTVACARDLGWYITPRNSALVKLANVFTDRFVANSLSVKDYLIKQEKIMPDKIDVIMNGVDFQKYRPATPKEREQHKEKLGFSHSHILIGCISKLRAEKGLDYLIQAAVPVCRLHQNVSFIILGDGPKREDLIRQAADYGMAEKVIFAGDIKDVLPYLHAFDIAVLSSFANEGLANAILEYMAVGLPVVATIVGGSREQIRDGETGFLVPPGDSQSIANSLTTLITDENLRRAMSNRALQYCREQFSMEKMIRHYEDYYMRLGA